MKKIITLILLTASISALGQSKKDSLKIKYPIFAAPNEKLFYNTLEVSKLSNWIAIGSGIPKPAMIVFNPDSTGIIKVAVDKRQIKWINDSTFTIQTAVKGNGWNYSKK